VSIGNSFRCVPTPEVSDKILKDFLGGAVLEKPVVLIVGVNVDLYQVPGFIPQMRKPHLAIDVMGVSSTTLAVMFFRHLNLL